MDPRELLLDESRLGALVCAMSALLWHSFESRDAWGRLFRAKVRFNVCHAFEVPSVSCVMHLSMVVEICHWEVL